MIDIILLTLLLALIQIVLLPLLLRANNFAYLLSNRDGPYEPTAVLARVQRAAGNLQESLPAFLVMAVIALVQSIDLTLVASVWLALRAAYFASYALGFIGIRTLIWMGALVCLVIYGAGPGGSGCCLARREQPGRRNLAAIAARVINFLPRPIAPRPWEQGLQTSAGHRAGHHARILAVGEPRRRLV